MRSDHRHLTTYQIGCEVGQSVGLVLRPAILDRHILALDIAGFTKALAECGQIGCTIDRRRAAKESYHRHRGLLRARRERPRGRAAEQRDELASPHAHPSSGLGPHITTPLRKNVAVHHSKNWALMSQMSQTRCRVVGVA